MKNKVASNKSVPKVVLTPFEERFYDSTTQLHTFQFYLPALQKILHTEGALGLVVVDVSELSKMEYDYGKEIYTHILKETAQAINSLRGQFIRENDILTLVHPGDEVFLVFLSEHRPEYSQFLKIEKLQQLVERFIANLNAKIFGITLPYTKKIFKANIGFSYIISNPLLQSERMIYRLIEQAKNVSRVNGDLFLIRLNEELKEMIIEENVETHFQPIVNLSDGSIFAYEALSRGPQGGSMENPLMLFGIAEKSNLSFELDRLCRRKAIQKAKGLPSQQKLFINVYPATMHDPQFRGEPLTQLLSNSGLVPQNIVFEITERFAIENYALFQKEQAYYSSLGFSLAVDDIGTGYGSLEAIANLRPEFVKVDISLIQEIDKSSIKQELMKAMIDISRKVNAAIIAEGIETQKELNIVKGLGADLGQGFYFAKPSPHFHPHDKKFQLR